MFQMLKLLTARGENFPLKFRYTAHNLRQSFFALHSFSAVPSRRNTWLLINASLQDNVTVIRCGDWLHGDRYTPARLKSNVRIRELARAGFFRLSSLGYASAHSVARMGRGGIRR